MGFRPRVGSRWIVSDSVAELWIDEHPAKYAILLSFFRDWSIA